MLKRRTVARRRAFRQRHEGSVRTTAEKILINQMKGRELLHGIETNHFAIGASDDGAFLTHGVSGRNASTAAASSSSTAAPFAPAAANAGGLGDQFDEDDAAIEWRQQSTLQGALDGPGANGSDQADVSDVGMQLAIAASARSSRSTAVRGDAGRKRAAAIGDDVDDGDSFDDSDGKDEADSRRRGSGGGGNSRSSDARVNEQLSEQRWSESLEMVDAPTLSECIERAAEKTGFRLTHASGFDSVTSSRLVNGSIVVPPLRSRYQRHAEPAHAMQFEVLEEIQLAERAPATPARPRRAHHGHFFAPAARQLHPDQCFKQVNTPRADLNEAAQQSRRRFGCK